MARPTTPGKPHRQYAAPELVWHDYNQWRLRRSLKIRQMKDRALIVKSYEGIPRGMYTSNGLAEKECKDWGVGPRPIFLNPYQMESTFTPKHKTKKEIRGSNPVRRIDPISRRYKKTHELFYLEQQKARQVANGMRMCTRLRNLAMLH